MNRPKFSEITNRAVADKLADDVMQWIGNEAIWEQVIADLEYALGYGIDGYSIAKHLERGRNWDADAELVEAVEGAYFIKHALYDAAVQDWVVANAIKPKLPVRKSVKVKNRASNDEVVDGVISSIDEKRGTYTVFVESMGHVRPCSGTIGIVLPFEEVESQNETMEACAL